MQQTVGSLFIQLARSMILKIILCRGRNDRTDIRRVFGKMQTLLNTTALTDSTVIFDLGTYCRLSCSDII